MPTNLYRFHLFTAAVLIVLLGTFSTVKAKRASQDSGSVTTVVIDAGHGGHDRGGIPGQRVAEKDMTNSYPDALFVCIHFNSANRMGAGGIETYFYSRESLPLASAIHYFVAGGAPSSNRGVRRRGYYVLRKTTIPAVLVECGFLTNPTEAAYAQTASYRQKLAEEIATGVRGRNSVTSALTTTRVATSETIPLQPYIDQTKVAKSERHRSKRSHKKSARRKKGSSKPAGSETKAASEE
jgi:N-acetylmuramoyl-L-alanine amidase